MSAEPTRLHRCSEHNFRRMDDSTVIMTADDWNVHVLNETGTRIWELLAEPRTPSELVNHLCEEFEINPDTAHQETERFLTLLEQRRLITSGSTPG